jgi:cobalamin biosynthesis protein CobT
MLQNRVEDVRIERELARPYPGTRMSIATVLRRMLAEGRMAAPETTDHPAQVLAGYLLLALRHEVLGQTVLAAEARKAADTLGQVFPAPFVVRLRTLMDEVPGLTSTAEAVDLARRIRRLIADEADQPSANGSEDLGDPDNEEQTDQSSGDASGHDDTEFSQENNASQQGTNGEGSGEEAAPDAPESASDENEDVRSDGSDTKPDNRSGTESLDAVDANTETMGDSGEDTDGTDPRDTLAAVLAAGAGDCDGDLFTEVGRLLGTEASATSAVRLPLPEDYTGNASAGMRLLGRVQAESARLSARLQGLVQASRMDRPRSVKRGRRLDPRRLHRAAVSDERIFARRAHRIAPNTAVHLLVDLSGSMHATVHRQDGSAGTRAGSALESALALGLALNGIPGVTVAVTAFPGQAGRPDRVTRMVRHSQSPRACAGAFIQAARGGTPMAQALWYAAADLLACREERRLVMVLTDGAPDDATGVLRLLALCRQADIETVGVGIGIDIRHLFPTAIEVTEATDLKRELFSVAERLLVGVAA